LWEANGQYHSRAVALHVPSEFIGMRIQTKNFPLNDVNLSRARLRQYIAQVVERIAQKFKTFKEAEEAERRLHKSMTPDERMRIARELRDRVFPGKQPDVREWHRSQNKS
jgi:signal transduction histidine kinase